MRCSYVPRISCWTVQEYASPFAQVSVHLNLDSGRGSSSSIGCLRLGLRQGIALKRLRLGRQLIYAVPRNSRYLRKTPQYTSGLKNLRPWLFGLGIGELASECLHGFLFWKDQIRQALRNDGHQGSRPCGQFDRDFPDRALVGQADVPMLLIHKLAWGRNWLGLSRQLDHIMIGKLLFQPEKKLLELGGRPATQERLQKLFRNTMRSSHFLSDWGL